MSENIQEFLINRPSVAPRDTSLIPDTSSTAPIPETEPSEESEEQEIDELPVYGKRLAMNLQKKHQEFLTKYCIEHGITAETFVEAMVVYLQGKPKVLGLITEDAVKRLENRKQAAVIRSSLTNLKKRGWKAFKQDK